MRNLYMAAPAILDYYFYYFIIIYYDEATQTVVKLPHKMCEQEVAKREILHELRHQICQRADDGHDTQCHTENCYHLLHVRRVVGAGV